MLNEKQSLPCLCWCHSPLFFLHWSLRFILLLLLHHSDKPAIHHDHLFLLLQILHLVFFKSLQHQGELRISGYSRVFIWWARDCNRRLSFLRRADLPFVWNGFVAIYFRPIFDCHFRKKPPLVLQHCNETCVVISGRSKTSEILGCAIDLVDGAKCKCKRKCWFVFYAFLWTCQETDYFRLSCELVGYYSQIPNVVKFLRRTYRGCWRGGRWKGKCQLVRCTNQRWGSKARNNQEYVRAQWFVDITDFFPGTTIFHN